VSGFVLDSSVALTWCFPDEATPATDGLLERVRDEGAVPDMWRLEVSNVVLVARRNDRLDAAQAAAFFALLAALPIRPDLEAGARAFEAIFTLGVEERLTSYDAAYLELALRRGLPLATKDKDLARACRRRRVPLLLKG
jgi:predicted nucleic acid-binding protein